MTMTLSHTQIHTYLQCPARYYFKYRLGLRTPLSSALAFGRAFHAALECNFAQKMETRRDLSIDEVRAVFAARLEELASEVKWEEGESLAQLLDQGADLLGQYIARIAPSIQPVLVEHRVDLTVGERPFTAVLDLVDESMAVIDHKTLLRAPTEGEAAKDLQLTAYAAAYRELFGSLPRQLVLHCAIRTKQPRLVTMVTTRDERAIQWWERVVSRVALAIEAEQFYPNPAAFICSEKHCDFWHECHSS